MSSLGSSFINKSTSKKPAPKAPPPRKKPGTPLQPALRKSPELTRRSQTPQVSLQASTSPSLSQHQSREPLSEGASEQPTQPSTQLSDAHLQHPNHVAAPAPDLTRAGPLYVNNETQASTERQRQPDSSERPSKRARTDIGHVNVVDSHPKEVTTSLQVDSVHHTVASVSPNRPLSDTPASVPSSAPVASEQQSLPSRAERTAASKSSRGEKDPWSSYKATARKTRSAAKQDTSIKHNKTDTSRAQQYADEPSTQRTTSQRFGEAEHPGEGGALPQSPDGNTTRARRARAKRKSLAGTHGDHERELIEDDAQQQVIGEPVAALNASRETEDEVPPNGTTDGDRVAVKKTPKTRSNRGKKREKKPRTEQENNDEGGAAVQVEVDPSHDASSTAQEVLKRPSRRPRKKAGGRSTHGTSNEFVDDTSSRMTHDDDDTNVMEEAVVHPQTSSRGGSRASHSPSGDDDDVPVDSSNITMFDLTRRTGKGQSSKLESALRKINWKDIKRRKEEEAIRALQPTSDNENENDPTAAASRVDEVTEQLDRADQRAQEATGNSDAPTMKLVNGELVFDTTNLNTQNTAQAAAEAQASAAEADPNSIQFEESDITNRMNTQSFVGAHRRNKLERLPHKRGRWSKAETEKFYEAIGMFGADFTIIQRMFPDLTRRQIKLKFVREEKSDPARMKEVMVGPASEKVPMSLAQYAEWTGRNEESFRDPSELDKELEGLKETQRKEMEEEEEEVKENVRKKREKAKERQKLKEKARREKRARERGKGVGKGNEAEGGDGGEEERGGETGVDEGNEANEGNEHHDNEADVDGIDGNVTQSIEA